MVGDERRECKGERRETIEGGFKAGPASMLFPTPFPAGFSFLGRPQPRLDDDVNQYVQIPATLFRNPCYHPTYL